MLRIILWAVAGLIAVLLGLAAFGASQAGPKAANIATRWVCPCMFVEDRTLQYCMDYLPIDVGELVSVQADPASRTVTATSLLVFQSKARHEPGLGCLMNPPSPKAEEGS